MAAVNNPEGLRAVFSLYRTVLRLHRAKLKDEMRELGDAFVGSEFRAMVKSTKATQQQWREFAHQWQGYVATLAPEFTNAPADAASSTAHLAERLDDYLSPDQQKRVDALKKEVGNLGRSMHERKQE
mmetsp:Transcript_30636/g.78206  ORF Transcript_30636/g.78206 Transcript_30636/m.78206 type:complete len:127 (-) Transcript_30636:486-866(-)